MAKTWQDTKLNMATRTLAATFFFWGLSTYMGDLNLASDWLREG